MKRVLSAILGGAVGTAVLSVVLAMLEVEARYAIDIFGAIARFVRVPGNPALGFAIYAFVGTVVWPLLFLSLERYVPLDLDPAIAGMLLGSVLWFAFAFIGKGEMNTGLLLVYLTFTWVAHLAYGFSMGAVYAPLSDYDESRNPVSGSAQ
jgi:hypothetical protein